VCLLAQILQIDVPSWNDDDSEDEEPTASSTSDDCVAVEYDVSGAYVDAINLDVTAMLALCSNLTNGHANYAFVQPGLQEQAALERQQPALPFILRTIKGVLVRTAARSPCVSGKRLICCRTAYDSLRQIVRTVGGPTEQQREQLLLAYVHVVDDHITERVRRLTRTDVLSDRAKVSARAHRTQCVRSAYSAAATTTGPSR
jgi:hypothetical protein